MSTTIHDLLLENPRKLHPYLSPSRLRALHPISQRAEHTRARVDNIQPRSNSRQIVQASVYRCGTTRFLLRVVSFLWSLISKGSHEKKYDLTGCQFTPWEGAPAKRRALYNNAPENPAWVCNQIADKWVCVSQVEVISAMTSSFRRSMSYVGSASQTTQKVASRGAEMTGRASTT